uniref:Angiotensin-converting enzyme n=1 Tax=Lycosa tarantula TaxID=332795 RepID=A0A7G7FEW6_LYCTA|nr:putative angiotensin converting enzyme precursor [Lycosa tarantula]
MEVFYVLLLSALTLVSANGVKLYGNITNEEEAKYFLLRYDIQMTELCRNLQYANWLYATNINNITQENMINSALEQANYIKNIWPNVTAFAWPQFKDKNLQRQMKFISTIDIAALPLQDLKKLKKVRAGMSSVYSTTTICDYKDPEKCDLRLDQDLTKILATSENYDELLHVWKEWHEKVGRPMRKYFPIYVSLTNKAAKLNGFNDTGEMWLSAYESDTFTTEIKNIWLQIKPLYQQIHAYVRRKLINQYRDVIREDGPIPAHVLGNMWAQNWQHIERFAKPFPNKSIPDATKEMLRQNYTVQKMFEMGEEFFTSLGLKPMPEYFWTSSMFERPIGREVICHASAWDFCAHDDVRIKMCTVVNNEDFITVHHEMGHIQYYLQYGHLPIMYRDGANPGFHEAIGDTLALSAGSSKHLNKLRLLPNYIDDYGSKINSLFAMAASKIMFLPFSYVTDLWRWKIFKGEITEKNYNSEWWKLRKEYQGIEPAVSRSEIDFDPGAKYHIANGVEYLRYFVSHIIQFQFHKALCLEAGQYEENNPDKPLHECDIYGSKEAGTLMRKMLMMGSSKPWPEAMSVITKGATNKMDAGPMLEYFKPLEEFLKEENRKNNEFIGWRDSSLPESTESHSTVTNPTIKDSKATDPTIKDSKTTDPTIKLTTNKDSTVSSSTVSSCSRLIPFYILTWILSSLLIFLK